MKTKNIILIASCVLTLGLSAQTVQKREITPFSKIDASGASTVYFTTSDTLSLVVEADAAEINFIETVVQDNTLFIKSKGHFTHPFKIKVSGNNVNLITVSGASDFYTTNVFKSDSLTIESSGASKVQMDVTARSIKATCSGASDLNLTGNTQNLYATASGAANFKSYKLNSLNTWATASGASTVKVFATQKIFANASGASTIKFKGDPKEVSAEGSISSQVVKVGSDDTVIRKNGKDSTSTSFNFGRRKIIIMNGDRKNDSLYTVRKKNAAFRHWDGFFFGVNGYVDKHQNFYMDKPYNYMELDYTKSFNYQLNLFQHNIHIYKNYLNLAVGLGFNFNQYQFMNKIKLNADSSFTDGKVDNTNIYNYKKNRFYTTYITVPLLLDINTSTNPKKAFHLSAGVVGQYLITSRTKQLLTENGNTHKNIRYDNYNLNPFQFMAYASVGYGNITLFAQYGLNEMFQHNKGPELYAFSVGVRLLNFN